MNCHYCKRPLNPAVDNVVHAIWGWETTRDQHVRKDGGSDILYRQRFDRWAHYSCVLKERSGVSASQGSLL